MPSDADPVRAMVPTGLAFLKNELEKNHKSVNIETKILSIMIVPKFYSLNIKIYALGKENPHENSCC